MMADWRTYRRNTLFGPEHLRARAIDRDRRRDAEFHHCAQPSNFNLDGAEMAATDQSLKGHEALAMRGPSINGPRTVTNE